MPSLYRRLLPLLVLLVGLTATGLTALALYRAERGQQEARFSALADRAAAAIDARMVAQLTLLRGTAGFFNASRTVDAGEFRTFVDRLRLGRAYPGVLGIGFAAYGADRQALSETAREVGQEPGFRVWPEGERQSAIVLLEPLNRLNRAALGFDMTSEPTRREAMIAAAASGHARLSGRVRLVQEIEPVKQPGFLIYLPIVRDGRLRGWAYSPLRAWDLIGTIFAGRDLEGASIELFDAAVAEDRLLYRSAALPARPASVALRRLEIAGRPWIVRISSAEAGSALRLAVLTGASGLLISVLLAILILQQTRAAARVEREVAERTAELSAANARMREEAEAREAAESQVRQMQKMEAIGQLTGGIAHDFNNMLAVVMGNLDLAERRLEEPDRAQRAISNARSGAEKAADLTQRLLAYGRRQSLAPRPIDPNALVAGMADLVRRALGEAIPLRTRLAEGVWPVHSDPVQLESAILNIAINGRDAMPDGGTLTIETANRTVGLEEAIAGDAPPPGDFVLIAISDTGTGMSPEVAGRALEPFFTTKEVGKGSGLGLSQVYGFVKQSGGHFALITAPGSGTRVELYLPRCAKAPDGAEPAVAGREPQPASAGSGTILVVEDEARVREMSVEALTELGYRVLAAEDGEAALVLLDRHPEIDLVFTDLVMPRMSGQALAAAIAERRPALPVVFTTGYAGETGEAGAGRGEARLLQKPFTTAQLAEAIGAALRGA